MSEVVDSIDFDFLLGDEDDGGDLEPTEGLWEPRARDPRIVRSIESVADDAEARHASLRRGGERDEQDDNDDLGWPEAEIFALHESELECLWPQWGERRCAQLGRGIPAGVTIEPQHLPRTASNTRPLDYK